jgi:hypothetical protein
MIEIQGLTRKQRLLADIIWALDTQAQVQNFIRSLPPKDREQAEVITEMIILAFVDQCDTIDPEVSRVIDQFRLTK